MCEVVHESEIMCEGVHESEIMCEGVHESRGKVLILTSNDFTLFCGLAGAGQ